MAIPSNPSEGAGSLADLLKSYYDLPSSQPSPVEAEPPAVKRVEPDTEEDVALYVEKLLKEASMNELLSTANKAYQAVSNSEADLQSLLHDNYRTFFTALSGLNQMNENATQVRDQFAEIGSSVSFITRTKSAMDAKLEPKFAELHRALQILEFIRELHKIYSLPRRMRELIDQKKHWQALEMSLSPALIRHNVKVLETTKNAALRAQIKKCLGFIETCADEIADDSQGELLSVFTRNNETVMTRAQEALSPIWSSPSQGRADVASHVEAREMISQMGWDLRVLLPAEQDCLTALCQTVASLRVCVSHTAGSRAQLPNVLCGVLATSMSEVYRQRLLDAFTKIHYSLNIDDSSLDGTRILILVIVMIQSALTMTAKIKDEDLLSELYDSIRVWIGLEIDALVTHITEPHTLMEIYVSLSDYFFFETSPQPGGASGPQQIFIEDCLITLLVNGFESLNARYNKAFFDTVQRLAEDSPVSDAGEHQSASSSVANPNRDFIEPILKFVNASKAAVNTSLKHPARGRMKNELPNLIAAYGLQPVLIVIILSHWILNPRLDMMSVMEWLSQEIMSQCLTWDSEEADPLGLSPALSDAEVKTKELGFASITKKIQEVLSLMPETCSDEMHYTLLVLVDASIALLTAHQKLFLEVATLLTYLKEIYMNLQNHMITLLGRRLASALSVSLSPEILAVYAESPTEASGNMMSGCFLVVEAARRQMNLPPDRDPDFIRRTKDAILEEVSKSLLSSQSTSSGLELLRLQVSMKSPIAILDSLCKPRQTHWSRRVLYGGLLAGWRAFAEDLQASILESDASASEWTSESVELMIAALIFLMMECCAGLTTSTPEDPRGPKRITTGGKGLWNYLLAMTFQVCHIAVPAILERPHQGQDAAWLEWLEQHAESVCKTCSQWSVSV